MLPAAGSVGGLVVGVGGVSELLGAGEVALEDLGGVGGGLWFLGAGVEALGALCGARGGLWFLGVGVEALGALCGVAAAGGRFLKGINLPRVRFGRSTTRIRGVGCNESDCQSRYSPVVAFRAEVFCIPVSWVNGCARSRVMVSPEERVL